MAIVEQTSIENEYETLHYPYNDALDTWISWTDQAEPQGGV